DSHADRHASRTVYKHVLHARRTIRSCPNGRARSCNLCSRAGAGAMHAVRAAIAPARAAARAPRAMIEAWRAAQTPAVSRHGGGTLDRGRAAGLTATRFA